MITKKLAELRPGQHFYTYTQGMRGHFAVEMWMNNREKDLGVFAEPWDSDSATFAKASQARERAMFLAEAEDLPFVE